MQELVENIVATQCEIELKKRELDALKVTLKGLEQKLQQTIDPKLFDDDSINEYRRMTKKALEIADDSSALKDLAEAWKRRYCDWTLETDPADTRKGNRTEAQKIKDILKKDKNVRKIAQEIHENGNYFIVDELTPDTTACALAAYIVRNCWEVKGIEDGEWDDDHKPTDFEELRELSI